MKRNWLLAIAIAGLYCPSLRAQDEEDPFAELDDLSDESLDSPSSDDTSPSSSSEDTAKKAPDAPKSAPQQQAAQAPAGDALDSELSDMDLDQELASQGDQAPTESAPQSPDASTPDASTADAGDDLGSTDDELSLDDSAEPTDGAPTDGADTAASGADAATGAAGGAADSLDAALNDELDAALDDVDDPATDKAASDDKANKPETAEDSMAPDELDAELADSLDEPDKAPEKKPEGDGVKDVLTPDDSEISSGSDVPSDITDLEDSLDGTSPSKPTQVPDALRESESASSKPAVPDLQSSFDPSDAFARVPLRPQMSDQSWKKWAGPNLEKVYRVRRGDSLWGISDRLFGNPFLWPKVWQLNAYITNANIVDPGMELEFVPGNPNSAPMIAMLNGKGGSQGLQFVESRQELGFIDRLELTLKAQLHSADPPFKHFLLEELPKAEAKMPPRNEEGKLFFVTGDEFPIENLADGTYSVVRGSSLASGRSSKTPFRGYNLNWLGKLKVTSGRAKVLKSFKEIEEGDLIVSEDFSVSPLSISEEELGEKESKAVRFVSIEEGYDGFNSAFTLIGVRFSGADKGPGPGAILSFDNRGAKLGTGVLIHRSGRYGTLWVSESKREILSSDKIR